MSYPTDLDNFTPHSDGDTIQEDHVNELQTAVEALEAKVGADSSAVATSLDYKVTNTASSNPGHKHTLANGATDVTASAAEVNTLDGYTGNTNDLNLLAGQAAAGLSSTELGYVNGVTSAIQTQLNAKAASSHNHAASEITSGTIAQDRLGTGSGGAGTKALYDDQTYKTITAPLDPNVCIFATEMYLNGATAVADGGTPEYAMTRFADSGSPRAGGWVKVPKGYSSVSAINFYARSVATTGSAVMKITTAQIDVSTTVVAPTDSTVTNLTCAVSGTTLQFKKFTANADSYNALTLAEHDLLWVELQRISADGADDLSSNLDVSHIEVVFA